MLNYKVENKFNGIPLENIELKGKMAAHYDRFFCGRVLSDYAKGVVYKECEDAFLKHEWIMIVKEKKSCFLSGLKL